MHPDTPYCESTVFPGLTFLVIQSTNTSKTAIHNSQSLLHHISRCFLPSFLLVLGNMINKMATSYSTSAKIKYLGQPVYVTTDIKTWQKAQEIKRKPQTYPCFSSCKTINQASKYWFDTIARSENLELHVSRFSEHPDHQGNIYLKHSDLEMTKGGAS